MSYKYITGIFLLIITTLMIFPSPSSAMEGGFVIPIGEDFTLPDDAFGIGNTTVETSKGALTGQVSYLFSYLQEHEDSLLKSILFTLPKREYLFDVQLDYNYDLQADSRLFLSANFNEEKRAGSEYHLTVELREAFVSHGFQQFGNLILGKQKLNFGNGFGWTPTGIYSTSEIQNGLISGRWSIPYKGITFTTVLVPPLAGQQTEKGLLYERVETNYGSLNLAVSGLIREEEKPRVGIDLSTFIGNVEIYAACSARQENWRTYLTEEAVPGPFGDELKTYKLETRDDQDWYLYGLIGSTYTIPGTETYLIAEYFYDQTGLTTEETGAVGDAASYCMEKMEDQLLQAIELADQYRGYLGLLNNYFVPGQMGRHYLFLGVRSIKIANPVSGNLYGIINLADRSGVINPELSYSLTGNTSLVLSGNLLFGEEKSEYGLSVMERKISLKTVTLF